MGNTQVDVTLGSSSKTSDAYTPNPIYINIGDTITWINKDSTVHTVTSGIRAEPDGKFDSSPGFNPLIPPQGVFSHTFEEAGEFSYYCGIHPNMVGVVIVGKKQESTKKAKTEMKVFISYSTKDRVLADHLFNELRDRDFSVWIDRVEMRPGDSLTQKIKQGVTSADALLVLVTQNSIKSKWVRKEVRLAIAHEKKLVDQE